MKHLYILTVFFLVICLPLSAQQTGKIVGHVLSSDSTPLTKATVRLLHIPDSSLVTGVLTQTNGSFVFEKLPFASYLLEVRYIGYTTQYTTPIVIADTQAVQQVRVVLDASSSQTQPVTVTATRTYIEREIDRTVINIDALQANTGRTLLEVLEQTPGVIVDKSGTISMKGKPGIVVFIDDKPTYLAGTELQSYLASLPATIAEQIELIPNPPAMYDAAGNAGIINIKLKRVTVGGFFGNASVNYNQGRYARSNNSLNLTLNKQDYSVFSNIGVGVVNSFQDLVIYRHYKNPDGTSNGSFVQNSIIRKTGTPLSARLGADWYASSKSVIGLSCRGMLQPLHTTTNNIADITQANGMLVNTVTANNTNQPLFANLFSNANYRYSFDSTGTQLTCDADYVWYKTTDNQRFINTITSPNQATSIKDELTGNLPIRISIYALKSDFIKPLPQHGITIQCGVKSAYSTTDNTAQYSSVQNGVSTPNYALSNQFLYNELISAGYANINGSISNWLEFQVGFRVEHTNMQGKQTGNPVVPSSEFERSYTNVFPTVFLQAPLDSSGSNIINVSYSKRIDRPVYQELNPFISPLDKYTYYTGNPYLVPSIAHNISVTHSWDNILTNTFEYNTANNGPQETIELKDSIYYSRPANITTYKQYSLQTVVGLPLNSWWRANVVTEFGLMQYADNSAVQNLDTQRWYAVANIVQSFILSDTWSAEVSGNIRSKLALAQLLLGEVGQVNMSVQKTMFNGKGTLKFSVNDMFLTQKPFGTINNLSNANAGWNSILDTRQASLSFSYKFGSSNVKRDQYNGNGSEGERQRVKQG